MTLQFHPHRLFLGEPVTFGQRLTYATDHPLDVMLGEGYFQKAQHRLRPGDTIRIIQLQVDDPGALHNRVIAFADVLVSEVSADGITLTYDKAGVTTLVPGAPPEAPKKTAPRMSRRQEAPPARTAPSPEEIRRKLSAMAADVAAEPAAAE